MATQIDAPETLATRRLVLRRARVEDADAVSEEYAQDAEVTKYLVWRPHENIEETREFFSGCEAKWKTGTEYTWAVTVNSEDRAVGMIAARVVGHAVDIGYVLAKRFWGRGMMSEAAGAIVAWAIEQPRVFRVWAVCDAANAASARVLEKAGMEREGLLRRWLVHPNISAEPRDCLVYAKVRAV
ncbi:MAG TPA: GNAT family N-acetyltransferase [Tepidisphaeraceae bacterium]|nr:GNAT family N-acetyltransferase [Tepidisphaeraceae bacterium]